jgi:hypothetical protein
MSVASLVRNKRLGRIDVGSVRDGAESRQYKFDSPSPAVGDTNEVQYHSSDNYEVSFNMRFSLITVITLVGTACAAKVRESH